MAAHDASSNCIPPSTRSRGTVQKPLQSSRDSHGHPKSFDGQRQRGAALKGRWNFPPSATHSASLSPLLHLGLGTPPQGGGGSLASLAQPASRASTTRARPTTPKCFVLQSKPCTLIDVAMASTPRPRDRYTRDGPARPRGGSSPAGAAPTGSGSQGWLDRTRTSPRRRRSSRPQGFECSCRWRTPRSSSRASPPARRSGKRSSYR